MSFLDKAGVTHLWTHIIEKLNTKANANDVLLKTPQELTQEEIDQVHTNIKTAGKTVTGTEFTIEGTAIIAGENAEVFNNYDENIASGKYSHAEGYQTMAKGSYAHAEGYGTFANAAAAHAEGYDTKATARYAHAEGASTTASGNNSHAEGNSTTASGHYSHAEGNFTTAAGGYSHAEGNYAQTGENGTYAHAEGSYTKATKTGAHAEGNYTEANGAFSHTEGYYTKAESMYQHVRGKYNIADDAGIYATIIGNGDANSNRKNIHTFDWNGNAWFAGDIYIGSTSGTDKDEGSKKLATEEFVNDKNEELNEQINTALTDKANQIEDLYKRLNSNTTLSFYCIEDVAIVLNGVSTIYPANSNVEIKFLDTDVFEIVPTSDNSILALNAFPGALGTYYSWLEGVKQFSNILFDMNNVDFYSKWSQGNQGLYQVQYAQYINCIFWSDNPYISEVSRRTNYTLYYTSQLPLCYSSIPDNTFKAFYLAFNVNSDPNWGNKVYRDSFAKATWATQVFSYYGARTIGIFGHDDPDFNIVLPKDCRGLMYQSTAIENAGTFDAINTTNFGATGGSWQQAFGQCSSLRNLYIKNLTVNLNVSWSPINYQSIYFIISRAANTKAITISVSPYTYNLLGQSDFELAASKNITIELITTNYIEDKRLSAIADKANQADVLLKTEQALTNEELAQVRSNLKFTGRDVGGQTFTIDDQTITADKYAEVFNDYVNNIATGNYSHAEGKSTTASGDHSHAEGKSTTASGDHSHAEGDSADALGDSSHAEGWFTTAEGDHSHAEGNSTTASGKSSHAEGITTTASGDYSHAEGDFTTAEGESSHAEGYCTEASGDYSHAEGESTFARSIGAHVEGLMTLAIGDYQHVQGKYNVESSEYAHIVGNGASEDNCSNAHTLDWDGNAWFAGGITVGENNVPVITSENVITDEEIDRICGILE